MSERWTEEQARDYMARLAAMQRLIANSPENKRRAVITGIDDLPAKPAKPSKYRNRKTADGFDSEKERARWQTLSLLQHGSVITDLERQPSYDLHTVNPAGEKVFIGKFTLDFRYEQDGALVIEDVKSEPTKTQVYRLRKRIFEAEYGLKVTEV